MTRHKHPVIRFLHKYAMLLIGSILAAVGLEIFLVPNSIIDGGTVGIGIMISYLTGWPLGLLTFGLYLPFLFFGYQQIGKTFVVTSLYSVSMFSIFISLLHPVARLTDDILLATVFGGIILGVGVGLIIRFGGSLDGTEIIAIAVNKKVPFSVGQIVMFFNLFIISSAGLIFGWERAMYSLIAYFITYKSIDIIVEGLDEAKAAMIVSEHGEAIAEAILARLGRRSTFLQGHSSFHHMDKQILYAVVTRLEVAKLKEIIDSKDKNAYVTIHDVTDLMGGTSKKSAIH